MKSLPTLATCLFLPWLPMIAQADTLTVVADHGGTSALPYYEALNLQPRAGVTSPRIEIPRPPAKPFDETDMLPVRSMRLSPGDVARRVIEAPGLPPFFLIGDDERSRAWLHQRSLRLHELDAVGWSSTSRRPRPWPRCVHWCRDSRCHRLPAMTSPSALACVTTRC